MTKFWSSKSRTKPTLQPTYTEKNRRAMLQGVYEENLRTAGKYTPPPDRPASSPERRLRASWKSAIGIFLFLFVIAAGVLARAGGETPTAQREANPTSSVSLSPALLDRPAIPPEADPLKARPSVVDLYGLELQTIVIDAGHGGRDPGATGQHGLHEKDVTLDVAIRLKERLEKYPGYRILLTRDRDEKSQLRERVQFANEHDADLFISLHVNSLADNSVTPIETYYYGPGSDARAVQLAERENTNSGFSVAEFNALTQQLGLELKIQESRDLAHSIQAGLYRNMRRLNAEISDWGAKTGDFMVLLGVEAPSVLVEIGSITNSTQERMLSTVAYRDQLALFLEEAVVEYLRQNAHEIDNIQHASQENEAAL